MRSRIVVEGRIALGPRAGARVQRYGVPPDDLESATPGPCHAQAGGFDLHAAIVQTVDWGLRQARINAVRR